MFKKIGTSLRKKQDQLNFHEEKVARFEAIFRIFVATVFKPPSGLKMGIETQLTEDELVIKTPSKTIAAELTLRLDELTGILREQGIRIGRIVIR